MAVDKLVDSTQLDADLTSVANAIRTKGGTSGQLAFPAGFVQAIGDISTGDNVATWDEIATRSFREKNVELSDAVTELPRNLFEHSNIQKITAPGVTTVGSGVFLYNNGITVIDSKSFPELTILSTSCFQSCTTITAAIFQKVETIDQYSFYQATSFTALDIGSHSSGVVPEADNRIKGSNVTFAGGCKLDTLIIRQTHRVMDLQDIRNFNGSAFNDNNKVATLYVPASLVSEYEAATNWSTLLSRTNNYIVAIEGSQYDGYYVDGTPIT